MEYVVHILFDIPQFPKFCSKYLYKNLLILCSSQKFYMNSFNFHGFWGGYKNPEWNGPERTIPDPKLEL